MSQKFPEMAKFRRQHSRPIHILLHSCERLSINSSYPSDLQIRLLLERHFCRLHGHLVGREGGEDGGCQPRRRYALSCPFLKEFYPSLLNGLNHGPLWQGAFLTNSFFRDSHHIFTTCREGNSKCQDILPLSSHWQS